jgi:hypothetical protein
MTSPLHAQIIRSMGLMLCTCMVCHVKQLLSVLLVRVMVPEMTEMKVLAQSVHP